MDITQDTNDLQNTEGQKTEKNPKIEHLHDDIISKALNEGVRIPKHQVEFMENNLIEEKVSFEFLENMISKVVEKHKETGIAWKDVENPEAGKAISFYGSKKCGTIAYILPFQKKNEPEKTLYKANLLDLNAPKEEQHKTVKVSMFPNQHELPIH